MYGHALSSNLYILNCKTDRDPKVQDRLKYNQSAKNLMYVLILNCIYIS